MNENNSFSSNQELYDDFPIKLKNQSTLTENEIVISFHKDFEIGIVFNTFFFVYMNNKFVHGVAEQEIWWFLDEISNNHYSIIQYKEEYALASNGRLINGYNKGHFLFLPKNAKKPFYFQIYREPYRLKTTAIEYLLKMRFPAKIRWINRVTAKQ